MKGIVTENKSVKFDSFDIPKYSPSQCLVEIHYAGINRADLLQKAGLYPPPPGESDILGLEFSGVIKEVGSEVNHLKAGDAVCTIVASGAYAEYVAVEAAHLIKVPENLSLETVAAMPEAFITAYQSLVFIANIKEGEKVLIHAGASGVGAAAIQMAKNLGAHVICTSSAGKHEFCYELGADQCVNYKEEAFEEVLSNMDMVLDLIGGSYFKKNLAVLGMDGRMVMLGFLGGVNVDTVNIASIVGKRLNIQGSTLRARSKEYKTNLIGRFSDEFIKDNYFPFQTNVDRVFEWEEVESAHTFMQENKNKGKILLKIK
ncbi:NAD(P)H-quinone oxidoreductase [Portibacter lacus]|uniref:NAD(P)H quinone oxidoreductase n=1 Tax=Portibacter lacus TaxID=1099794 RepID=A0AA37SMK2_9BACT|nr:NAD(P)H-quinone oxidoreductase [Portibacter lacus]GLR17206.1 NAD(P)H quinone oxidoreductase [Portibacter lacus]